MGTHWVRCPNANVYTNTWNVCNQSGLPIYPIYPIFIVIRNIDYWSLPFWNVLYIWFIEPISSSHSLHSFLISLSNIDWLRPLFCIISWNYMYWHSFLWIKILTLISSEGSLNPGGFLMPSRTLASKTWRVRIARPLWHF